MAVNNFIQMVKKEFAYLVSDYSFSCVEAKSFAVRFESDQVFVSICYDDKLSYETRVEIGQLKNLFNGLERAFDLKEILELKHLNYNTLQSNEPDVLQNIISQLALLLSEHAIDFLENSKASFKRLSDFREAECNKLSIKSNMAYTQSKIRKAWNSKNYQEIITIYETAKYPLSSSEQKKLLYAKRQIKK